MKTAPTPKEYRKEKGWTVGTVPVGAVDIMLKEYASIREAETAQESAEWIPLKKPEWMFLTTHRIWIGAGNEKTMQEFYKEFQEQKNR